MRFVKTYIVSFASQYLPNNPNQLFILTVATALSVVHSFAALLQECLDESEPEGVHRYRMASIHEVEDVGRDNSLRHLSTFMSPQLSALF